MDAEARRDLARSVLEGYPNGPEASQRATARALEKLPDADAVILVEGVSDQIALESAAVESGRDLHTRRTVVVPIGGAHAIARFLGAFGPEGARMRIAGLCDLREEEIFRRALAGARVGSARTRADMERLGFHVCAEDLEDELIRALGIETIEGLFDANGDLGSFRRLQTQPAWRGRETMAQMRRFLGSGASRKLRYARILAAAAVRRDALPRPLEAVLAAV